MNARVSYSFQRFPYVACPARSRGNPKISLWLSVDPLAEKYPGMSPYNYTAGDPINLVDPDGRCFTKNEDGEYIPCPKGKEGETRKGYFGYEWIMKDGEWQLNNNVDPQNVDYKYDYVTPDGSAEYYEIRYVLHIQKYGTRPPDYYLEYGYNNNKRFRNHKWKTQIAREWVNQTAIQLQVLLNNEIEKDPSIQGNNEVFNRIAYATHVPAYKYKGLLLKVRVTPDFMAIPFIPRFKHSFFSREGLKQIYLMSKYLGEHPAHHPINPLGGYMGSKL